MTKHSILIVLALLISNLGKGQKFSAEASLPKVSRDGFYKIALVPDLTVHADVDFSNMRIFDADNQEIPYLIQQDVVTKNERIFEPYSLVSKNQIRDSCTVIVWGNPRGNEINNISLLIKNAEVKKEAILSASDDLINWFALKQSFTINSIDNPEGTSEIRILDFPLSNYKYYRLSINDRKTIPINILKAGYYRTEQSGVNYFPIRSGRLTQSDSTNRKSYVRLKFDDAKLADKISWSISSPSYYLRNGSLFSEYSQVDRKGKMIYHRDFLAAVQLRSGVVNQVQLPALKTSGLLLIIDNEDSPPIKIESFDAFQTARFTLVRLERDRTYVVKFSDEPSTKPLYDLEYFEDSIRVESDVLEAGPPAVTPPANMAASSTIFTSVGFIWLAIGIVISLLGFMSYRLIHDMASRKGTQPDDNARM